MNYCYNSTVLCRNSCTHGAGEATLPPCTTFAVTRPTPYFPNCRLLAFRPTCPHHLGPCNASMTLSLGDRIDPLYNTFNFYVTNWRIWSIEPRGSSSLTSPYATYPTYASPRWALFRNTNGALVPLSTTASPASTLTLWRWPPLKPCNLAGRWNGLYGKPYTAIHGLGRYSS
jgi:hypothetical protein